ncbi:MAG: zf-HC2 domain-containing protein [Treponema sp.]|nr:zf-HC2 domain-containing protein [Treponema sp.]
MCPDSQLISLYKDGELPSPWKEKLEAHLGTCPQCSKKLASYNLVSDFLQLKQIDESHLESAQRDVWKHLSRSIPQTEQTNTRLRWKHPIVLPLPAAIAALVLVALLASLVTPFILHQGSANTQSIAKINTEVPGIVPVSDIKEVLRYLENQTSTADIVIIKLPDTGSFIPSGQPELIRAVDYQGRK